jgi:hypothetical protein
MSISQRVVDHGFGAIMRELENAKHLYAKVGFPSEGEVGPGEGKDMESITQIAAVHEFGFPDKNIPERSFIRATFDVEYANLQSFKESEYLAIVQGRQTAHNAIGRIGEWLTGKTKMFIRNRIPPPLKPATYNRKHPPRGGESAVPLIDTGQMINTIQWTITEQRA